METSDNTQIPKVRGGLKDTAQISVRCSIELKIRLAQAVRKSGVSGAELMRRGLDAELKKWELDQPTGQGE